MRLESSVDENRLVDKWAEYRVAKSVKFKGLVDKCRRERLRISPPGSNLVDQVVPRELFGHWGCGPTVLAQYYPLLNGGRGVSEQEVASRLDTYHGLDTPWSGGTEHWMMIKDIESRAGLPVVFGTQGTIEELDHWVNFEHLPVVVEVMSPSARTGQDECHYVLVAGVEDYQKAVRYFDPDDGRAHMMSSPEFSRKWMGFGPKAEDIEGFYLVMMDPKWLEGKI